jgi:hypothetical protein
MSGRFSTGVQLKKRHEPNYSGIAANSLFAKALEDESEDEDLRKGKINYVAIGERDRDAEDQFLAEEYVPDDPDEILQDDYDAHFDSIQHRRKLVFQGDKGNVNSVDLEICPLYGRHKSGR